MAIISETQDLDNQALATSNASPTFPDLPLSWAPFPSDSELAWHPNAYGLLFNRRGCFLLCTNNHPRCGLALSLRSAENHLKDIHELAFGALKLTGTWRKNLQEICQPLGLITTLPTGLENILPFAGLQVYTNLEQCTVSLGSATCGKIFCAETRSLETHLRKVHNMPTGQIPIKMKPVSKRVSGQQLSHNTGYFTVVVPPPLSITPNSAPVLAASINPTLGVPRWMAEMDAAINAPLQISNLNPGDSRVVEEWLNKLGWREHLKQYSDWSLLQSLVEPPHKLDFPWLRPAVLALFQDAMDLIPSTASLSLQKLRSPDPMWVPSFSSGPPKTND